MKKNKRIATISMFAGIIVVLQLIATFINFGGFPITLTLIPIIIAGALYGVRIGALMGTVFGIIVSLMVITGSDPSGATMLAAHPFITIATCVLKGTLCGAGGALIYKLLKNKNQLLAIILSAAATPIINTSCLIISIILFFDGSFALFIAFFMTLNFLVELLINVLLAPGLLRIINSSKFIK